MVRDDVDYMFKFAGYGNPESRIWFIGIEEGKRTDEGENMRGPARDSHRRISSSEAYYDPELPELSNPNKSSVWKICAEIAAQCGLPNSYFRSNMGALPRKMERSALNGLNERDYVNRVATERIPMLRKLSGEFKPAAIVFHGRGAWTRYRVCEIFGLNPPDRASSTRVIAYLEQRILLTNFFSRGWRRFTADDQKAVTGFITDLLLR